MTSITKEPYQQYITDLLDLEDSALRYELEMRKSKLTNEDWKLQRVICIETLLQVYTGSKFNSASFAWLLLDNRTCTKNMIKACLKYILGTNDRCYYTLVDWFRKFNHTNSLGVEFPETFSRNLGLIWDIGFENEKELEDIEGKITVDEMQFCMEIDYSSETKGNDLIDLEQFAINIGDANDSEVVGQLLDFRKEFSKRGTSDLWKTCMKHLLQPIHIAGVEMMLKLNHDYDYIKQWELQTTVLRMVHDKEGQMRGSSDEFITVVQLINSYANARKTSNFEKQLIACEGTNEDKKEKFLGRFEIVKQITPGRPEDINY